jgi:hypothetical protein
MKQDQLITFFRHVVAREATHGIQNFKSVLSGRKKGHLLPAQYGAGAGAGSDGNSTSGQILPTTVESLRLETSGPAPLKSV